MAERPGPPQEPPASASADLPARPGIEESAHSSGRRLAGFPARALALVTVAVLLAVSGPVLDAAVGPRGPAVGVTADTVSGALFCPHGGQAGWQGWVVVANPGQRRVRIRVTQLGRGGTRSVSTFGLGALRQAYRQVSTEDPADATVVEYFGGWVGATAILGPDGAGGVAAERCEPAVHRNWFVMDVPTGKDQRSYLVVMNPFAQTAEFDVVLRTEKRQVAAGSLTPYVLAPRHSVGIPVHQFLLQGPEEESLTARVIQRMGRVVAGGLEVSAGGIRAEVGLPTTQTRWILPAGADVGTRELVVLNSGDSRADLSAVAEGPSDRRLVSGPEGFSVGPGEVETFPVERVKDAGLVVEAANERPMLVALRLTGPLGDSAILNGSSATARRWLVLPALPPSGGRSFLLLQNSGGTRVEVSVRLIGGDAAAPASVRPRSIGPGRTLRIRLPSQGDRPVSALVMARGGTIVAAVASYSPSRGGYAATLGLPMK